MFRVPLFVAWLAIVVLVSLRRPFFGAVVILLHFLLRDFLVEQTWGWFIYNSNFEILYIGTIVGVLITRADRLHEFTPRSLVDWGMVGFLLALVTSALVNGVSVFGHKYIDLFAKATVLYFLLSRLVDTPRRVAIVAVSMVVATSYLVYLAWDRHRAGWFTIARPYWFTNFHEFGLQLIMTLPMVGALVLARFKPVFRMALFVFLPLYVLVSMRCWSRSAMVGALFGVAMLAWYYRRHWALMLLATPLVAFAIVHQSGRAAQRMQSIWTHKTGEGTPDTSIQMRLEQIQTAMNVIAAKPLFGVGPRQFFAEYEFYASPTDRLGGTYTMHSVPLLILCEEGLIGFAVYYGLLVFGAIRAARFAAQQTRGAPELRTVAIVGAGALMGFLAYCAYSLTQPTMWTINIYGTVALVEAARRVVVAHFEAPATAEEPVRAIRPVWDPRQAGTEVVFP